MADAGQFRKVKSIIASDPARRVVVVSAPGKRHAADHKVTDLLYLCHAHLQYGVSCWDLWRRIADRYREIRDGCCLTLPIEAELDAIYAAMHPREKPALSHSDEPPNFVTFSINLPPSGNDGPTPSYAVLSNSVRCPSMKNFRNSGQFPLYFSAFVCYS